MTTTTPHTPDRAYFDAIAAAMPGWHVDEDLSYPSRPHYRLVYDGCQPEYVGASLYTYVDTRSHKLEWSCNLHITYGSNQQYFILNALSYDERNQRGVLTVNIGLSKCPARVAKELQSRLLPRYLDLYARGMARVNATISQYKDDEALAYKLAAILGTKPRRQYNQDDKPYTIRTPCADVVVQYGSIRFTHHPSFNAEQAVQLCELFATWQKKD